LQANPVYWNTLELLQQTERWSEDRLEEYQVEQLRKMLRHCAANVPYYRDIFRQAGFDPESVRHTSDLARLPYLDKAIVRERTAELLATNIPKYQRCLYSTGGTTGHPLSFYIPRWGSWRERAFIDSMWSRVGFERGELRAILRGWVVKAPRHWTYDPLERALIFSNYHMTPGNAVLYSRLIAERAILYFHTYPSSAYEFARLLKEAGQPAPRFRAILCGSENFYAGQREFIEDFYGCRVFSWYGHSENLVLAGECESSTNLHVYPQYGVLELLREDGEIVGTTLSNPVMPLIRYRTDDWATVGPRSCACGRHYRLLKEVRGRWHQEMLIGKQNNRISMTALNMHGTIFDHVAQFQFYQREIGKAELRLVRKPDFTDHDASRILAAFGKKMGDTVDLVLTYYDSLPKTGRGKFRLIVWVIDAVDAVTGRTN
jgi:phenylacetate-CoA ligase